LVDEVVDAQYEVRAVKLLWQWRELSYSSDRAPRRTVQSVVVR
jgi:hypothetical protein